MSFFGELKRRNVFKVGAAYADLHVMTLGERITRPLLATEFFEGRSAISPDGRWIAYMSDETGELEIYVRPYPDGDDGKWQISVGGGVDPRWGPNGTELFFRNGDAVMAASVDGKGAFTSGIPRELFAGSYVSSSREPFYDVAPDGQRFLMMRSSEVFGKVNEQTVLVTVENWFTELERLAPPLE